MQISKSVLLDISSLSDIDSISTKVFCPDDIFLHRDKLVGLYIIGIGVVLEPDYIDLIRFGDILKVSVLTKDRREIRFGGYSITHSCWVIPPVFSQREFWAEYENHLLATKKDHPG